MSDSHKISLLDLQSRDLSQYGKKNLDQNQGPSRIAESSYRKQLSESISKKQSDPPKNNKSELESGSIDRQSDNKRAENKRLDTPGTSTSQEKQGEVEEHRNEIERKHKTLAEADSQVSTTAAEESISTPEWESQKSVEVAESTEVVLPVEQENNQLVNQKVPSYSLFDSTFVGQNEGSLDQEVTTEVAEIHPPANFLIAEEQPLVDLHVQVTETSSSEVVPIPEGLAELLKQQEVDDSQSDTGKVVQAFQSNVENQELSSIPQETAEHPSSQENIQESTQESSSISIDSDLLLQAEDQPELKQTAELQQAFQGHNSGDSVVASEEQFVDIQSIIPQQSPHTRNEVQSTSSGSENEEHVSDQESFQEISDTEISDTEIEQVTQELTSGFTGAAEKVSRDTEQAVPENEEVNQSPTNPNPNPNLSLNPQGQVQFETAKTGTVSQENILSTENDQPVSQQVTASQSTPASGTQSNSQVAPAVDAKQIEQLVERIVGSVRQSQSTGQQLKIRLSPPELGTLQIEVSLKNGEYTAKLDVQNNQVQKVINDNIAQLRDALAKSGVAIDRIEVNINTDSSEDQHSSQSDTQSKSGSEFQSEDFSDNPSESDQRHQDQSSTEESAKSDEATEQVDQENPQVARSQGVATENVEEIDVQI